MQRKNFDEMTCPIARTLDRVGEWWSILILRDAFFGRTRFDEFQKSAGIAPNILTRRLKSLVEAGLLEKRPYQERMREPLASKSGCACRRADSISPSNSTCHPSASSATSFGT